MARVLIVGGGCRGLRLAGELHGEGHAVRVVTRREERRAGIEAAGAECFLGDPNRLATMRPALEHVTVACWLLANARAERAQPFPGSAGAQAIADLHGSRLAQFLHSLIDSTVRGVVYEAGRSALPGGLLAGGERIAAEIAGRNEIPLRILRADPGERETWLSEALGAVGSLL